MCVSFNNKDFYILCSITAKFPILNCHGLSFNFSRCLTYLAGRFFSFLWSNDHLWDNTSKWMSHRMAKQLLSPYYQNLLGMWPIYTAEKLLRPLFSYLMTIWWHVAFVSRCLIQLLLGQKYSVFPSILKDFSVCPMYWIFCLVHTYTFHAGFSLSDITSSEHLALFLFVLHSIFQFPYLYLA